MDLSRLHRLALRQDGLFTRGQARACGLSAYQIRQRIHTGQWQRVVGWVLASATLPVTPAVRDRAVQLAVPGSVLAGPSAARRWDLGVRDDRIFIVVPVHANPDPVGAILLHEDLDKHDVGVAEGAVVTSRARTVFDCLRLLPARAALDLLDRALQRGWTHPDDLVERLCDRVGCRGTPRVVRLLREVSSGARSDGERRLTSLLRRAGLTGWAANVPIRDEHGLIGVGDVVFDEARVVIEVDGWAFHVAPDRFQRDRERQNRLIAAGWDVLRFTWRDLTDQPDHVVRTIKALLAAG
jgi:very-short-patch-repair endonuclease